MNLRKDHYGFEEGVPPPPLSPPLRGPSGVTPGSENGERSAVGASELPTGTRLASRGRGFKDLPVSAGRRPSGALPTAVFYPKQPSPLRCWTPETKKKKKKEYNS